MSRLLPHTVPCKWMHAELRPAPAPPVPNPASPTTPNAVRRRAPPRPPPPVVGAWRQSPSPSPSPTAVTLFECKDPEQDNVLHKPIQPTVSPKVSPSIDTNKALLDLVERDESGYIQALLLHQKERLDQFRREFEQVKSRLESARLETAIVEQEQYERRKRNRSHSLTSLEELQKLREENQRLRFECDCMTREVDFLHKGQVPLGETNEEFYESIHTGQAGLVLPGPSTSTSVAWASPAEARRVSVAANGPGTSSCGRGCDEEAGKWSCSRCTFCNDSALDLCEICGMLRFGRGTPFVSASSSSRVDSPDPCYCHQQVLSWVVASARNVICLSIYIFFLCLRYVAHARYRYREGSVKTPGRSQKLPEAFITRLKQYTWTDRLGLIGTWRDHPNLSTKNPNYFVKCPMWLSFLLLPVLSQSVGAFCNCGYTVWSTAKPPVNGLAQ